MGNAMNGHAAVIAARKSGHSPVALWFDFGVRGEFDDEPTNVHRIVIEATDTPSRLDLRFCYGLRVHVANDILTPRVEQLIERIRRFKPEAIYLHYEAGLLRCDDELVEII